MSRTFDLPLEQLREYMGTNPCPSDIDDYWDRGLKEMKVVDPEIELVESKFHSPLAECFDLYFTGVKDARVHAKYLRPKGVEKEHPAVLMFHGYTGSAGDWSDKLKYISLGFSVLAMDCRGQGGLSEDVGGVKGNTLHGHIIRGLNDKPENLLYRQIFLDTAELASIAMNMSEVDGKKVCAVGGSQGGALALACAALEPHIKYIASIYPFLCDYKRVWKIDLAKDAYKEIRDYFRMFDPKHRREDKIFTKLGYIDVQNLVNRIQGDVLFVTGLMDTVCPPSTQFAAYNKIKSNKRMLLYHDYGHEEPLPGVNDEIYSFMMEV